MAGYFKSQQRDKREDRVEYKRPKETIKDVETYPYANLTDRGIRLETTKLFNVRMKVSGEDGETPVAIYYPYYDKNTKLVGWKKRDLTLDKNDKYHFTTIGKVGVECKMFGQHVAETIQRKRVKLIIVEGENDVLASYQALADYADTNPKFKGMRAFVVGLNCGTGNAVDTIQHNLKFIDQFNFVNLAFDNDKATDKERRKGIIRGYECTENVAGALLSDRVFALDWSSVESKDPNDVLMDYGFEHLAKMLSFNFEKFHAEKVVTAKEIGFDTFVQERVEGYYVDAFPELMEKIRGFRVRELTVVTAPSGAGKSVSTAEIAYGLSEHKKRVAMIFLEEEVQETLQRMCARYLNVNYNTFKKNPRGCASEERLKEAFEWACNEDRFVFLDHFGSMKLDDLMNKIKHFVYIMKVDFIILDHLSMLVTGLDTSDERAALERTMVELAAFCASHDVGIIAVSHLNRNIAQEFKAPKGKENEPFWVNVRKEDLKGASGLEQLAWIVLGLEIEIMPDKSRGRVRWVVLKNRPQGFLGIADTFKMNDETGLLEDASETYGY